MADVATVRNLVDTQFNNNISAMEARQEAYRAENGRYWQGLSTHTEVPADGVPTAPDRLQVTPTDVVEAWPEMPPLLYASCKVHAYELPNSIFGWCCMLSVKINGDLHVRMYDSINGIGDWVVI